ncbi:NAD(+) diphosphatase [Rapidithrix thailandica]|uniref:NAD(+) diphosphatase n=1 Tax=Rapidithrix thailandica TaxID=413964 RepID=A0AAW9SDG1_9BACT
MNKVQYYSNSEFARAVHLRNTGPLKGSDTAPNALIPVWNEKFYCQKNGSGYSVMTDATNELMALSEKVIFLGQEHDRKIACIDLSDTELSDLETTLGTGEFLDLRTIVRQLDREQAALLAYAKGLARWNRMYSFCGVCGSATKSRDRGHSRKCIHESCGTISFPRIDPAIIVLIEHKPLGQAPMCLLNKVKTEQGYRCSTFAGFVEIGESLEDAVRREMKEEVDVEVGNIRYVSSQPWPFPASIMLGFVAEAKSQYYQVDNQEIKDAGWFTAQEIDRLVKEGTLVLSREDSIARYLIESWVKENL